MRYVKYIGLAHIRQITATDWRSVGLAGDTVVWSARNGFALPLDLFTEDQLARGIDPDPELIISDGDDEFKPVFHTRDMTPAQATQTVEVPASVVGIMNGDQVVSRDDSGASTVHSPTADE